MSQRFEVDVEITRLYRRFIASGTQLSVRLLTPPFHDSDPITQFLDVMSELLSTL